MANGTVPGPPQVVVPGAGWVDVATRAITQVGFPVVIAGVLLWFLLGTFQSSIKIITDRMTQNTDTAARLIAAAQAETQEVQRQTTHIRKQTDVLAKQTDHLATLIGQANQLIALHQQELTELQRVRQSVPGSSQPAPP